MLKRLICKKYYNRADREFVEGLVYIAKFIENKNIVFVYIDVEVNKGLYFTTNIAGEKNFSTLTYLWDNFETESQHRKTKLEKINNIYRL